MENGNSLAAELGYNTRLRKIPNNSSVISDDEERCSDDEEISWSTEKSEEDSFLLDEDDSELSYHSDISTINQNYKEVKSMLEALSIETKTDAKKDFSSEDGKRKNELQSRLSSTVVAINPNVQWDDIAGLDAAKSILKKAIIMPTLFPSIFVGKRKPYRGILFYGPPGTGKTYLAKAVATEIQDCSFFSVSSSDLLSKWVGESEKLVHSIFEMANQTKSDRSVIFIDEIDALCSSRDRDSADSCISCVLSELLVCMDGVGRTYPKVLVLGATNLPWKLDAAIRRRFEKRVYIPLPTEPDRCSILKLHTTGVSHDVSDAEFQFIAKMTHGFSASDLEVLVRDSVMGPITRCEQANLFLKCGYKKKFFKPVPINWKCTTSCKGITARSSCRDCGAISMSVWQVPKDKLLVDKVSFEDFEHTLTKRACSSVDETEIKRFVEWTEKFGEIGK